ncbi:predicted protein, partial [Postia placenta Mad-698-R]
MSSAQPPTSASDPARIDLAAYLDLLWSIALGMRPAELVQELLLILHERLAGEVGKDAARCYVYKAALGIAIDRAEEAADMCPCDEFGHPRRQRTASTFARRVPPKAKEDAAQLTYIMVHVRVDGPTLIRIHSYVHLHVASPKERAGLTMGAGMAVLDTV